MDKKTIFLSALIPIVLIAFSSIVYSHCQIPCGIYGDPARFDMIAENITTIEKSISKINELSNSEKPDYNQIVRWAQNKEKHADDTAHIITYYFLAQRIKPVNKANTADYEKYIKKLTLFHEMLIYTMKTKQATDLENAEKLKVLIVEFRKIYFR